MVLAWRKGPSGGFSNVSQQRYDKCEYNDVVDTIDMVNAAQVNCMNDPQVFGRLLEDVEKPLYPGCMKYTKLSALLLGDMLPLNNEMPLSMYEAKKTFSALGPRQPGKNIDVYLSPLVDDLKTLWEKGVETYDAHLHEVRLCGPVYFRWMYPFERYMKVLKGYFTIIIGLKGCIAECYLAEEAVEFCTEYLSGTHAIGIPKSNNYDKKFGRPITGGRSTNIDHKSWLQAHHYVLENTTIVQPYIEEHMNWLKSQYPRQSKRQIWLQEEHMRCFTYWLKGKVEEAIHNGQDIPNTLRWLAHGPTHQVVKYPGYIINGCRYHTKERDMTCVTQNSGVSILAGTMQIASSKDKNPCDWVDNKNGIKMDELGFTLVDFSKIGHKSNPFILASQAKQVFYVEDQLDPKWSIILSIPPKDFNMEGLDDFTDNCMEHHPFISSMPEVESFDVMNESEAIYMREDCEGNMD
ncbi:hypothetical protein CK203_061630 [Vitis vinifera]|uniref:DUF4216 domain-containing protein n=1 Tax=Vitis vinifera TaxID=29760 RepID=A0A438FQK1_VITVI|nr:hypothetical protein CK203_061630 [Vitis vinifera]